MDRRADPPARRLVALYSPPKVGKSLLLLEIAVAVARAPTSSAPAPTARAAFYVDFENDPKVDTRDRLKPWATPPPTSETSSCCRSPPCRRSTRQPGGAELIAAASAYACDVVVIDTVSRAIRGEENENDTWLNFYRHTGLAIKQAGLALIRLDHTGKDETKGQRGGGSAKSGDVDAIWRLSKVSDAVFRLDCEAARLPIAEKTLVLHRETSPRLRHRVDAAGAAAAWKVKVDELIGLLDDNQVPDDASVRDVRAWKNGRGLKASNQVIEEAVRVRKARLGAFEVDR